MSLPVVLSRLKIKRGPHSSPPLPLVRILAATQPTRNFILEELATCRDAGNVWFRKAVAIALTEHQRELVSKVSKLSLEKDTDVAMVESSTHDIKKTIEAAVAKAFPKDNRKFTPSA